MGVPPEHWVLAMFADGDSLDVERAMRHLSDDVSMRICNQPVAVGKAAARASFVELTQSFAALRHEVLNVYDVTPELTVTECRAIYTLKNGRTVENLSCNHLRHRNGLVYDNRIFMDPSPIFAAGE
jgi:ketosteroid isomerase-like protein